MQRLFKINFQLVFYQITSEQVIAKVDGIQKISQVTDLLVTGNRYSLDFEFLKILNKYTKGQELCRKCFFKTKIGNILIGRKRKGIHLSGHLVTLKSYSFETNWNEIIDTFNDCCFSYEEQCDAT